MTADMSRRTLLRLGLVGAPAAVVLLKGGGRALASPASASMALDPTRAVSVPGQDPSGAMFGRMFPKLTGFVPNGDPATALAALADAMLQPGGKFDTTFGAARTYALQILDHDVTLDVQPQPTAAFSFKAKSARDPLLDPDGNPVLDYETKKVDLSMIYGGGPSVSPELYQADKLHFIVGPNVNGVVDLPRRADGSAIVVETRDDENEIISQLHVSLLLFHNAVVDQLKIKHFAKAQKTVIHYWQWLILHDLMPTFFGQQTITDMLDGKGRVYDPGADVTKPVMPIEFSVGAYRFGHFLVRNAYAPNPVISPNSDSRNNLFTGVAGATGTAGGGGVPNKSAGDLHGGYPLTLDHQIDWRQWHEALYDPSVPGLALQVLKQPGADGLHMVAQSLFGQPPGAALLGTGAGLPIGGPSGAQPSGSNSLMFRDFIRAFFYQMPSGQDVARAYGLTPIAPGTAIDPTVIPGFEDGTPLLFYVGYEAFLQNQGVTTVDNFDGTGTAGNNTQAMLGPVGARICTDVLLRLLQVDKGGAIASNFKPAAPIAAADGSFGLADLLRFAGVVPSGSSPAPALGQNAGPQS